MSSPKLNLLPDTHHNLKEMPTKLLTLGRDPAITAGFMKQLEAAKPGKYSAYTAHSPEEFKDLAELHKSEIDLVLLGAAQTNDQARVAQVIMTQVWGEGEMRLLRLPGSLLTEEGKKGGMLRWFLEKVQV